MYLRERTGVDRRMKIHGVCWTSFRLTTKDTKNKEQSRRGRAQIQGTRAQSPYQPEQKSRHRVFRIFVTQVTKRKGYYTNL